MTEIKNNLLLKALKGEDVPRPPVWMMRQAGRYLPDYIKLRDKYSFFERVETPELATEITVMPVNQIGVDAAIIFSDILVILQAMGFKVEMKPGVGPLIVDKINNVNNLKNISEGDEGLLEHVYQAIKLTRQELNGQVPLIGFAGAPWTIFCYLIEGHGSKNFSRAKSFCFKYPEESKQVLLAITNTTVKYLKKQVEAGADVIQIFDSWGGLLSPNDYSLFSMPFIHIIIQEIRESVPVIIFPKGCWYNLNEFAQSGASAISIDWVINPEFARKETENRITLQGNFDPSRLLSHVDIIKKETINMVKSFGTQKYIANLGHGILPNVPVEHAKAFVDTIKEWNEIS